MKTARSTTNTISVNHQISQTVLHAAQITAVAFLTLVLAVGLQVATASLAHATHAWVGPIAPCEVDEDCWIPPEPDCLAENTGCMHDGWLSAWVDIDRELSINGKYIMTPLAQSAAVWENVDFSPYNRDKWFDPFRHCIEWCAPHITLG